MSADRERHREYDGTPPAKAARKARREAKAAAGGEHDAEDEDTGDAAAGDAAAAEADEEEKKLWTWIRNPELANESERHADHPANRDARHYGKALDMQLVFQTCGVCSYEGGLDEMGPIDDMLDSIAASGLPKRYREAKADKDNDAKDKYAQYYARTIAEAFDERGFLLDSKYVCNDCVKDLTKGGHKRARESDLPLGERVPAHALLNGYWTGKMHNITREQPRARHYLTASHPPYTASLRPSRQSYTTQARAQSHTSRRS
jgi:hypothetical protein